MSPTASSQPQVARRVVSVPVAHEHAHLSALGPKRVDDVGADEAGRAGDEDHSKFLQ